MTEHEGPQPDSQLDEDAIYRAYFPTDNSATTTTEDDDYAAFFPTDRNGKARP